MAGVVKVDDDARRELSLIIDQIPLDDRQVIADLPVERLPLLHHGLGRLIRNQIRRGELKALFRWSSSQAAESNSLDDRSWPIIVEVAKLLKSTLRAVGKV